MKKYEPSQEQAAVVDSGHSHLVVRAAAGAGKTRVLVSRYLRHVERDRLSPDQILTITFTKKAAAEMKSRIVGALREKGLMEQAQIAETGPIQTFHSFCERLLKENAIAAGLDPEFEILSQAASARMLEEAIQHALAGSQDDNPLVHKLVGDLAGRRSYNEWTSPHSLLSKAVREILHTLRPTGIDPTELAAKHVDPEKLMSIWRDRMLDSLPAEVRAAFESDTSSEPLVTKLKAAFVAAKHRRPKWVKALTPEADIACAEHTAGLVQLATRAWRYIERRMDRDQALDFTALEAKAVGLLQGSESARQRVQKQYRIVLVDEAQDVNPVQYQLLEAMGLETQMFVGDAQQSIYGFRQADVQLFREKVKSAQAHTLELSKNWRSDRGILSFIDLLFGRMWSEQPYVPMLDGKKEIDLDATEAIQLKYGVEFWHQQAKDTLLTARWVKELVDEAPEVFVEEADETLRPCTASDVAVLVRHTKYALDLLPQLEALGVKARIAGGTERFYTRLEVRDVANALRALADPYNEFALLATLRSPFAGLSLDSIVLLGKTKPPFENLESFIAPVPEDELLLDEFRRWFLPLRGYADRMSAWEVISALLSQTSFLERLARGPKADQRLANVRKLLALAAQEPDLGPLQYAERLEEIQSLRHPEGDAPATDDSEPTVTIMTIHKAKGLEFPIVVVPETHWPPASRSSEIEIDASLGLATFKMPEQPPSVFHLWLESRRHDRDEQEELRVLYVALTRAQKRLCICLHPRCNHSWLAGRICQAIGYKDTASLPPGIKVRE
ncbi:MAG: UvrD-helicase domain-containing protein [Fimbriimonadaceae bacterium]